MSHPTIPTMAGRGASPGTRLSGYRWHSTTSRLTQQRQRDEHQGGSDGPVEVSRGEEDMILTVLLDMHHTRLAPHAVVDQSLLNGTSALPSRLA